MDIVLLLMTVEAPSILAMNAVAAMATVIPAPIPPPPIPARWHQGWQPFASPWVVCTTKSEQKCLPAGYRV
jgi:hypothetical protein